MRFTIAFAPRKAAPLAVLLVLLSGSLTAAAQATGSVSGRLRDTAGVPIADATIEIAQTFWRARSQHDGSFRLPLPPGVWTLRIARIGYQSVTREVSLTSASPSARIDITLHRSTLELAGVVVTGTREQPFVETLTSETVRNVPALGEADVFRSLPLLAGVTQPNDILGRVHLGGGASDEHAVRLDGHPLQSPFHLNSVLGAFNTAALERADISMHSLPASFEGSLSGVIDLTSRKPSAGNQSEGVLSLVSSSLTLNRPALVRNVDVMASGRVTYLDRVLQRFMRQSGRSGDDLLFPSFSDAMLKLTRSWSNGSSVEALGFRTDDHASASPGASFAPPRWGESLLGLRAAREHDRWSVRARASRDFAFSEFKRVYSGPGDAPGTLREDFVDLRHELTSACLEVEQSSDSWRSAVGAGVDARAIDQRWEGPRALSLFQSPVPALFDERDAQTRLGMFGELTSFGNRRWSGSAGLHLSSIGGGVFPAPRLSMGARLGSSISLQIAAGRRHQFSTFAGEPEEGGITQPIFLLRQPRIADHVALSSVWLRERPEERARVRVELSMFARRYIDRVVSGTGATPQYSEPGRDSTASPGSVRGTGRAAGASLAVEAAHGRGFVLQGNLTAQRSRESTGQGSTLIDWDVPLQLSLFGAAPVASGWSITSTLQWHTGTPVTPVEAQLFVPQGGGRFVQRYIYGERNSARLPFYGRLDLGVRRSWDARNAHWTFSAQAVNVLNRTNVLEYNFRNLFACASLPGCRDGGVVRRGLPFLPSVGMEVRW